jgi:hypothetical protein
MSAHADERMAYHGAQSAQIADYAAHAVGRDAAQAADGTSRSGSYFRGLPRTHRGMSGCSQLVAAARACRLEL